MDTTIIRALMLFALYSLLSSMAYADVGQNTIDVNGVERSYLFYLPPSHKNGKIPLVLVFHGGQGDGEKVSRQTGFNEVADKGGFAVAYPDSLDYWNDGRATTGMANDDTVFVRQLIDHLAKTANIDRQRIYATGASNGGMFTLRLACELADEIAAFAPVIASFPVSYREKCHPARPVPMMMINGTKDKLIQWEGGTIHKGAKRGAGGEVIPVPETAQFWREHNKCSAEPEIKQLPDKDKNDETTVKLVSYTHCAGSVAFQWVQVEGGGHGWPGSKLTRSALVNRMMGAISQDIDASSMIWEFFREYTLP